MVAVFFFIPSLFAQLKFKVTRAVSALTTKEIRAGDPAKDVRNKEELPGRGRKEVETSEATVGEV